MLTTIRLEAVGATASQVEETLYPHARLIEELVLGMTVEDGSAVIERDLEFAAGSSMAWKGRLVCHLDISAAIGNVPPSATSGNGPGGATCVKLSGSALSLT